MSVTVLVTHAHINNIYSIHIYLHILSALAEVGAHGGWATGATSGHQLFSYMLNPSVQSMRAMAGVHPLGGGYSVPHIEVLPEDNLVSLIMPKMVAALRAEQSKSVDQQVITLLVLNIEKITCSLIRNEIDC